MRPRLAHPLSGRRAPVLVLAIIAAACAGCGTIDVAWLARQGVGQAEVLFASRPIARFLDDKDTPPTVRRRLALVMAARDFARDDLGLDVKQQYRSVVFLNAPAIVYVTSAAPRTSLKPVTFDYPLVGALPYRGAYQLEEAETFARELAARGYDVSVRPVTTYSLLGLLPDPVLSSMLYAGDEAALVETVIHELAHATVFAAGQGAFNEGLATFIGREGRRLFIERWFGQGSATALRASALDRDEDAYAHAVAALAFDLRVLFAQEGTLSDDALLDEKNRIFLSHQRHWQVEVAPTLFSYRLRGARLPDNNAELSAFGIYTLKQHVYAEVYEGCRSDMRCLLAELRAVAKEADPELALTERVRRATTTKRMLQ